MLYIILTFLTSQTFFNLRIEIPRQKIAYKAHHRMRNRVRYDWNIFDFIYSILNSIPFLFACCCRQKNKLHLKKRNELFQKGEEKFVKEFDAVQFAKSMREVQTLLRSMMDDNERFMIPYQKSNSIPMRTESEGESGDENYDKVPNLFAPPEAKNIHSATVDAFMEKYSKEEWSCRDFRLLNGVVSAKKLHDSDIMKFKDIHPVKNSPHLNTKDEIDVKINSGLDCANSSISSSKYEETKTDKNHSKDHLNDLITSKYFSKNSP